MRFRVVVSCVFAFIVCAASAADAQSAWQDIKLSASAIDYDLSGTGQTAGVVASVTRTLTPHVALELRSLFARPCQQFQSCEDIGPATLIAPEAQLQYRWSAGRLEPYVGAGVGASMLRSALHTDWAPTVSFSAGTGVRLTERLAVTGEFRVRGHEWRFAGSTTEIAAGLAWRLPRF